MPQILWSQDFFAKGELSPLMYSRVTLQAYYQGLKRAKNVLCFPQGAAGKRFGTIFLNQLSGVTNYEQVYFKSFQYLNECCYLILFKNNAIDIYLEGELIASVAATGILADEVQLIDHTILENKFRVTTGIYPPKDLVRSNNAPVAITGFTASTLQIAGPFGTIPFWYPARFTAVTMPTTSPQIHASRTYFIRVISATDFQIHNSAEEAALNTNPFTVTNAGVGANLVIQNTWTFSNVSFSTYPQFDFSGGYDGITFTPAFTTGYGITITMSAIMTAPATMDSKYVGGAFRGNGGLARIVSVTDTTHFVVDIVQPFASAAAIPGSLSLLTQPAWSDAQGWPRKCSSFQNRAFFANTDVLSNGLWGSYTNDFNNFDDLTDDIDDDSAISWFPTSDNVNYIQFIVPYRSLTVHTNSGIYSTPLSVETVITPTNFSLSLQDSTPADFVQPQGIDNQIIVLSGNDAHSLLWDGFNNAYTSNIISVANEHLINTPIDEAPYTDKIRAGSRYMFIVNEDGTLAIYQSLIGENVSGFTSAQLEQSYGNAYFRAVTSNFDGRAWFLTEREISSTVGPYNITAFSSDSLTNSTYAFPTDTFTAITFTGATLPDATPSLSLLTIYWAVGIAGNEFKVYVSQEDATNGSNAISFSSLGVGAQVTIYELQTVLMIEQLSFDAEMDCVTVYPTPTVSGAISSFSGQSRFNGQEILLQGDGFGFTSEGVNDTIYYNAHGVATSITSGQWGFPINVEITPMPISLSISGNPKGSNLVDAKHLRVATFTFSDTVGGTITQDNLTFPIVLNTLNEIIPGNPPTPQDGSYKISVMGGWDDYTKNSFTINHSEPFGFKLTGIFYKLDV